MIATPIITSEIHTSNSQISSAMESYSNATAEGKVRKKRQPKKSKLEELGWDSSLSWSYPRFKKYMNDKERSICSIQNLIYFSEDGDTKTLDSRNYNGAIITTERGPRIEQLCVIIDFKPSWITHANFQNLISPFTITSKSSKFILINSAAKSWGKSKVTNAIELFNTLISPKLEDSSYTKTTIDISTEKPVPKIKIKPKKKVKDELRINTNIEKAVNEVHSPPPQDFTGAYATDTLSEKYSEITAILTNFSEQIKKVSSAFSSLQESLVGLNDVARDIDNLIGKNPL